MRVRDDAGAGDCHCTAAHWGVHEAGIQPGRYSWGWSCQATLPKQVSLNPGSSGMEALLGSCTLAALALKEFVGFVPHFDLSLQVMTTDSACT